MESNKITMIASGDFLGLTRVVSLSLEFNHIVSVAADAFVDLAAYQLSPGAFNPLHVRPIPNYLAWVVRLNVMFCMGFNTFT